jgi:hypothetical protein
MSKRKFDDVDDESTEDVTESDKRRRIGFTSSPSFVLSGKGVPHPELPGIKVRLRPYVAVSAGKINKIAISGRTPSPFGRAMGDHTVAWQVVVDDLHSVLYGLSLDEAVRKLGEEHKLASDWMQTKGTPPKLLLRELEDVATRWQRLEDATHHATRHLDALVLATDDAVRRSLLGQAMAHCP